MYIIYVPKGVPISVRKSVPKGGGIIGYAHITTSITQIPV